MLGHRVGAAAPAQLPPQPVDGCPVGPVRQQADHQVDEGRHVSRRARAVGEQPGVTEAGRIKASVVIWHGSLDSFTSEETIVKFRKSLDDAHVDYEFDIYGSAKHGFAVPDADKRGMPALGYNQKAAERSWQRMLALFEEKFGKVPVATA